MPQIELCSLPCLICRRTWNRGQRAESGDSKLGAHTKRERESNGVPFRGFWASVLLCTWPPAAQNSQKCYRAPENRRLTFEFDVFSEVVTLASGRYFLKHL